ncbi:MAG TPA: type II toxin-antitoxin system RelE/ParE family toxin [Terracidiphilus sp.]|nr:type II toxin-antitoxin system RelE/ParE family toxin [Terracidiphilus sp.]
MHSYRLTIEADKDIDEIGSYTTATWGWRQAGRYLSRIEDGLELLLRNPSIGRASDAIRPGLRRFEIGHHVVFYVEEDEGILIVRVLHERMLPAKYI